MKTFIEFLTEIDYKSIPPHVNVARNELDGKIQPKRLSLHLRRAIKNSKTFDSELYHVRATDDEDKKVEKLGLTRLSDSTSAQKFVAKRPNRNRVSIVYPNNNDLQKEFIEFSKLAWRRKLPGHQHFPRFGINVRLSDRQNYTTSEILSEIPIGDHIVAKDNFGTGYTKERGFPLRQDAQFRQGLENLRQMGQEESLKAAMLQLHKHMMTKFPFETLDARNDLHGFNFMYRVDPNTGKKTFVINDPYM